MPSSAPGKVPVVIAAENMVSGVTSWARRLKQALASHPRYEVRLVNCVPSQNPPHGFDADLLGREAAAAYLAALPEAIVVPNFVWDLFPIAAGLRRHGKGHRLLGCCRSDSESEYYRPLSQLEPLIDRFVAVSAACQAKLARHLPASRKDDIDCLPAGIRVPAQLDRTWSVAPVRLAYAGRMSQRQKRILDLAGLARELERRAIDYRLDIAGPGREAETLKRALRDVAHGGRVRLLGRLEPDAIERLWARCDIHILPSEYEGTSNSMLESMATGCAQVLTRPAAEGHGLVRHGLEGLLSPVGDMASMAAHAQALARDPARLKAMGLAAHAAVRPYATERHATAFAAILDRILEQPERPDQPGLGPLPRYYSEPSADGTPAA